MNEVMEQHPADIWILTETHDDFAPRGFSAAHSPQRPFHTKKTTTGSRWISIWTKLTIIEALPAAGYDATRSVAVRIHTDAGRPLLVCGVVLPWMSDSLFRGRDARLSALQCQLAHWRRLRTEFPYDTLIVAGDLNQDMGSGKHYGSLAEIALLRQAFEQLNVVCLTAPEVASGEVLPYPTVDHIAVDRSHAVTSAVASSWPVDKRRLSDHPGIVAELRGF
jgi:endonuclease/exonuclease/phosphatase family metal-dependent hydrolase